MFGWVIDEFDALDSRAAEIALDQFPHGGYSTERLIFEEVAASYVMNAADTGALADIAEISESPRKGMLGVDENSVKWLPSKVEGGLAGMIFERDEILDQGVK